jgi:cytidylate kinase
VPIASIDKVWREEQNGRGFPEHLWVRREGEMAVVTISRQIGAGGWTLGQRLAKRLGYRYVDEGMIQQVADKVGVSPEDVRAFEKDGATKLMKFLDRVVSKDFIQRLLSDRHVYMDEKRYVGVVTAIIKELHAQGNVVIVGRGGQYILKGNDDVWKILLVDDPERRVLSMMDIHGMKRDEAEKYIRIRDQIRTRFLGFFADVESHDDPRSYDIVINMERVGMQKAEDIIVGLMVHQGPV